MRENYKGVFLIYGEVYFVIGNFVFIDKIREFLEEIRVMNIQELFRSAK